MFLYDNGLSAASYDRNQRLQQSLVAQLRQKPGRPCGLVASLNHHTSDADHLLTDCRTLTSD